MLVWKVNANKLTHAHERTSACDQHGCVPVQFRPEQVVFPDGTSRVLYHALDSEGESLCPNQVDLWDDVWASTPFPAGMTCDGCAIILGCTTFAPERAHGMDLKQLSELRMADIIRYEGD